MKPIAHSVEAEISALPTYEESTILYSPASIEASGRWVAALAKWYGEKGSQGATVSVHMLEMLAKQLRYAAEKMNDG